MNTNTASATVGKWHFTNDKKESDKKHTISAAIGRGMIEIGPLPTVAAFQRDRGRRRPKVPDVVQPVIQIGPK